MDVFTDHPYNLSFRDLIEVRARAYNIYGWQENYSPVNTEGITVRRVPSKMNAISVNAVETTTTQITVYWASLTLGDEIGDSALTTYHLMWDQNSGGATDQDWYDLIGYPIDSLAQVFTAGTNVGGGLSYQFRVRAGNIYGYGEWSDYATFKASQEPQQISSSSISTTADGLYVTIAWDEPEDNYDTITKYLIEIRQADLLTFTESAECDGTDSTLVSSLTCQVLMATLRDTPYELVLEDFVVARVKAFNAFGWSLDSQPNTGGAKIQTEPAKMAVPIYEPLDSDLTSVQLQLTELSSTIETGGYAIDSYHVEMYNGLAWVTISGGGGDDPLTYSLDTVILKENLNGGATYKFRVRAHNIHGWGERSDELELVVSGRPDQPDPVMVQIVNLDVQVSWQEPASNNAEISAYRVKLIQSDGTIFTEEELYCDGSQ